MPRGRPKTANKFTRAEICRRSCNNSNNRKQEDPDGYTKRLNTSEPATIPEVIFIEKKSKEDIDAVKGICEELTKDLDTKEKNKNNNEHSNSSYIIYDHTSKNPDDEGEGLEDINDNKVEANEQRLKHRNPIKVK